MLTSQPKKGTKTSCLKQEQGEKTDILICVTHELVSFGLCDALAESEEFRTKAVRCHPLQLFEKMTELCPDVIITDMGGCDSYTTYAIRGVLESNIKPAVIVIDEERFLIPALRAGASGFLSSRTTKKELLTAVNLIVTWKRIMTVNKHGANFALVRI